MIRKAKTSKIGQVPSGPVGARRARPGRAATARLITEDEADILFAEKHKNDKRYPLRDLIEENGDSDLLDS